MSIRLATAFGALIAAGLPLAAQDQKPPAISEAQKQAIIKVQTANQAQNWAGVLQASTDLLENFPDTPYKQKVSYVALQAAQNSQSYDQQIIWGDRIIQSDPNDILARVQIADSIAQHTRENDLDKDQSLKKIDDYAHQALTLLQNATAAPANLPIDAAKWPEMKQQLTGQADYALGASAELKKDYADAQKQFQAAADADTANSALYQVRLSKAALEAKQYDVAIAAAQKAIDSPTATPALKSAAQQQQQQATKLKGTAK